MKTNEAILAFAFMAFALVFSSGCLGAEEKTPTGLNATETGNETFEANATAIENVTQDNAAAIEPEPEEMINLTLKAYSNFESAELNGLRSLDIGISRIYLESDKEVTILESRTIDLKDTKEKMTLATLEIPASNYRTITVSISGASGLFELSSSIPGILAQRQEKDLIMKSSEKTISLSREINESLHLTLNFNIGNITFSKPTFDNSLTGATILAYSTCDYNCNIGCTQMSSFESCYDSCVHNGNSICDGNAVDLCNSQCNCPNNDCTYSKDEDCRSACIKREQAENSECKVNVALGCPDSCKEKPEYHTCMRNCNSEC